VGAVALASALGAYQQQCDTGSMITSHHFFPATRRAAIAGIGALCISSVLACDGVSANANAVLLPDYRKQGDLDDTEAFRRALEVSPQIHFPGGRGSGTDGAYLMAAVDSDNLPSGLDLSGDGPGRSIIRRSYRREGPFILHCDSKSANLKENICGLRFRDLSFEDEVESRGFSEFDYLVMLNGVSEVLFENVHFIGFRGDAVHMGSSTVSKIERHNQKVVVRNSLFDGITCNNRNAISVIDCDGLLIEDCRFRDCSRFGGPEPSDPFDPYTGIQAPGAIDLEPNQDAFAILRDVVIRNNSFSGGGGYGICLNLLADSVVDIAQSGIVVERNRIADRWGGFGIHGGSSIAASETRSAAISFERNMVERCKKPFIVDGVRGLTIRGNTFADCATMGELGYVNGNRDVVMAGNAFRRLGYKESGYGVWIRDIRNLDLHDNKFVDIGLEGERFGIAIAFVSGEISGVSLLDNAFYSPTGRMTEAITVFADAQPNWPSFVVADNTLYFAAPAISRSLGL
jgi:hypothetical protein